MANLKPDFCSFLVCFFLQNVSKPGHRRTDSTHSSNESEYTYNSEYAELEEGSRAAEVRVLAIVSNDNK